MYFQFLFQEIPGVKISNASADFCTFFGVGSGSRDSTGGLIENLTTALRSPKLKGGSSFQETLAEVIRVSTVYSKDDSVIKPQMISTLTKSVDFPHLENPYEVPNIFNFACYFTIFGNYPCIIHIICCYLCILNVITKIEAHQKFYSIRIIIGLL